MPIAMMAGTASAATRQVDLQCFTNDGGSISTSMAGREWVGEHSALLSSDQPVRGFLFDPSTDEEIFCQTVLPSDYDDQAATNPSVTFFGWKTTCGTCLTSCGGIGCPTTRSVELEVSSLVYRQNGSVGANWGPVDSDTASQSCSSDGCGAGSPGFFESKVHVFEADATSDAGNWSADDLVYIRIKRDAQIQSDMTDDFIIVAARLTYATN
jgi:hypothetical protein